MNTGIKILVLEHDPNDIDLLQLELKKTGWDYQARIVQTRKDFEETLISFRPDIILAAYKLPSFDGQKAFGIRQQVAPNTPFIIVSGSIGEESAVELIKMGVTDYVLKEKIYQVVPKILRALKEAEIRRQKRKAKKQLKKREAQLRKIMDLSMDVICTVDQDGRFVTIGAASKPIWGYEPEELIGTRCLDLVHAEDREKTQLALADLLRGMDLTGFENRYIRPDGTQVALTWSGHWEAGDQVYYCVARDATEIKQAAQVLQRNEKRFRSLLQNSTDGLTLLDAQGQVIERSPAALKILGLQEKETPDMFRTDLVHPEDLDLVLQTCAEIKKKPYDSSTITYRLLTGGACKWIEVTLSNLLQEPAVEAIVLNFRDITRKKLDEIALRENEARLRQAQAIGHFGFWEMHLVDKQQNWTADLYQICETNHEETPPTFENFLSLIHPADLPGVKNRFREAEATLENGFVEFRITTCRGGLRYVVSEWQFIKDEQGNPLKIIGILQDVTSRNLNKIALLQSEARLKEAQAIGNIAHWEVRMPENTTFWSDQLFRLLGVEQGTVSPSRENFIACIHPDDRPGFLAEQSQARLEGRDQDFLSSLRLLRPDGQIRYLNTKTHFEFDEMGSLTRVFGILQDVTDMRLTEKAREQSEQKYRNLFNFSPTPMWVYDAQTLAFLEVNQAAIQHYGYSKEEFASMTLRDIRPQSEIAKMEQVVFTVKGDSETVQGTFQHLTKAGELIEVDIQSSSLHIEGRQARLIIANDISEKVRYLQAIQTQNARLKEIAWTQSHVVRAPLARLMGLIALLQEPCPHKKKDTEIFDFILASAQELDVIIRDIVRKAEQINDQPKQA